MSSAGFGVAFVVAFRSPAGFAATFRFLPRGLDLVTTGFDASQLIALTQALLEAGVRIYLYPKPAVLHTKCFVVDGKYGVMGSSNMDMRSFGLNYEISLLTTGGDLVDDISAVIDDYREKSHELTIEEWEKRPWPRRYMESVMRLTSSLQ